MWKIEFQILSDILTDKYDENSWCILDNKTRYMCLQESFPTEINLMVPGVRKRSPVFSLEGRSIFYVSEKKYL